MRTLTYRKNHQLKLGIKTEKGILDVEKAVESFPDMTVVPRTTFELIQAGSKGIDRLETLVELAVKSGEGDLFNLEENLEFGPCVDQPGKIICIGLNYRKHAEESNMEIPEFPIVFSKFNNALAGHHQHIKIPKASDKVDYEAELVIIIGKETSNLSKEDALSSVYGYCTGNDLSARDLQFRSGQWLIGKTLDGFCPIGPYLVSADEVENPNNLIISTRVNGEERQNSNTSDMIFSCEEIISYLSEYMTLSPGDIIMTGTPEGVMMGYAKEAQKWIQPGDDTEVEIEGLGTLNNRFVT